MQYFRYNIEDSNINDVHFDKLDRNRVPDVILVKKYYGDRSSKRRQRVWKLKHLTEEATAFDTGAKCVLLFYNNIFSIFFYFIVIITNFWMN